ncbi:MAG: ribosome silencing factor [Capnocytophaga sp.]|nr:ribosome silencing factor [Capnocytophaga sp.]
MIENKTDQLVSDIIKGIEKVKGNDITLMDLRDIENTVCDYFIICTGQSNTQVNAIANSVQKVVSQSDSHQKPWHVEGEQQAEWVLIDYVDIVVHVFQRPIRERYDIEGLWGDAKISQITTNY